MDPDISSADIAVGVKSGVVTLTGFVRSYRQKTQAEADAKRVIGVTGVANDIEVRLPAIDQRPDPEIARDVLAALKADLPYSSEHIKPVVKSGWVTLEGDVEWHYQRERAAVAAQRVWGVKGVTNSITLKPTAAPSEIKHKIEEAFRRSAEIDANHVTVDANGGDVICAELFDRGQNGRKPSGPPGRPLVYAMWTTGSPSALNSITERAGGSEKKQSLSRLRSADIPRRETNEWHIPAPIPLQPEVRGSLPAGLRSLPDAAP